MISSVLLLFEFEEVTINPVLDVRQTDCDVGEDDWDDGSGKDVYSCVISIAVKI